MSTPDKDTTRKALLFWNRVFYAAVAVFVVSSVVLVIYTYNQPFSYGTIQPIQYLCLATMAASVAILWLSHYREEYWKKRR